MRLEIDKFQPGPMWNRVFVSLGVLSAMSAFIQSVIQMFALRISVRFFIIPYIWFFILHTWATIIYMGYTVRLLYLRRQSDLSKIWWYSAVVVIVVNPAQSVWWWMHDDHILTYVSAPASVINFLFFVLVCRRMASGRLKRKKKTKADEGKGEEEEIVELEEGRNIQDELELR